jgi:hypothetical protein
MVLGDRLGLMPSACGKLLIARVAKATSSFTITWGNRLYGMPWMVARMVSFKDRIALCFGDVVVSQADGEMHAREGFLDGVVFAICMDRRWFETLLDIEFEVGVDGLHVGRFGVVW